MAKILYEVKQNQNSFSAAFGKWYAQIKNLETLNTRKLANHISEHGSIYTPDVVYGVLEKFRSCLVEMLLNSKKVKIEGLGTFYCTLENQKNGALKKEDFNVNKHLKALHIRFLPEQATEENISSREFLKKAEFINIDTLLQKEKDEENGGSNGGGSNSGSQGSGNSGEQNGDSGNSGEQNGGSQAETVAAPTISGETPFDESTQVTISGPDGAEIRYTVDGSTPTAESSLYSEALTLTDTVIVKAIAIKNGVSSEVASKTFTKNGSGNNGGGFDTGS
jgi:predicted histone-like DNA-binding protein